MSETTYTTKVLPVNELLVDHRVQREALKMSKVANIERDFNPDAVGVVTVSYRADHGYYIIDGMHRVEAIKRKTGGAGEVLCHVFEGLTLEQEAAMFLDLNYGDQPTLMDKYRVRIAKGDPAALRVNAITGARGWTVSPVPANGNINAVGALLRLDELSVKFGAEPHLLDVTLMVISRAWGINRYGSQAVILEGLGRLLAEHGSKIKIDVLIEKLRSFPGGPETLHAEAVNLSRLRKGRTAMAVADIITETYNKGRKRDQLPAWRRRS